MGEGRVKWERGGRNGRGEGEMGRDRVKEEDKRWENGILQTYTAS